jgi:hypothetical protein
MYAHWSGYSMRLMYWTLMRRAGTEKSHDCR